jgi:hypothetical protein
MKLVDLALLCALSAMAASADTAMPPAQPNEPVDGVEAFEDICLKTAPTFTQAGQAAKAYVGGPDLDLSQPMVVGFDKDQRVWVYIMPGRLCAVSTPPPSGASLAERLIAAVGRYASPAVTSPLPAKSAVGGSQFVFHIQQDAKHELLTMIKTDD